MVPSALSAPCLHPHGRFPKELLYAWLDGTQSLPVTAANEAVLLYGPAPASITGTSRSSVTSDEELTQASDYLVSLIRSSISEAQSMKELGNRAHTQHSHLQAWASYKEGLRLLEAVIERSTQWLRLAAARSEDGTSAARDASSSSPSSPGANVHLAIRDAQSVAAVLLVNSATTLQLHCAQSSASASQCAVVMRRVCRLCDRAARLPCADNGVKAMFKKGQALMMLCEWEEAEAALLDVLRRAAEVTSTTDDAVPRSSVASSIQAATDESERALVRVRHELGALKRRDEKMARGLFA
jgi:hypothetical protein